MPFWLSTDGAQVPESHDPALCITPVDKLAGFSEIQMREIKSKRIICVKGILFLLCAALACAILLVEHPDLLTLAMLTIAVWSFARFYYFAFYVMEKYVDPTRRFAGLWSLMREALGGRSSCRAASPARQEPRLPMCKKR